MYKKAMAQNTLLLIVGLVLGYLWLTGGFDFSASTEGVNVGFDASGGNCKPTYDVTLSSITSGVTHNELGNNNHELIITSADLPADPDNTTRMTFTATSTRTDQCYDGLGGELSAKLIYDCDAFEFDNVITTTDSTIYRTVGFSSSSGEGYNFSIDGTDWAGSHTVTDTTTWASQGSAVFVADVEDYVDFDNGIKDDYTSMNVFVCTVKDGKGGAVGTVTMKYLKD